MRCTSSRPAASPAPGVRRPPPSLPTPCCPPPAAHPLLLTPCCRTVHFQSENALLIDFSKGNGLPEIQRWKLRCTKSELRQFKNCVAHPPGPPPARPPGCAARRPRCRPAAAHPLLPTPCCSLPAGYTYAKRVLIPQDNNLLGKNLDCTRKAGRECVPLGLLLNAE